MSLTILWTHELEELGTVDLHDLADTGRLPAGQIVPLPRTLWKQHRQTHISTPHLLQQLVRSVSLGLFLPEIWGLFVLDSYYGFIWASLESQVNSMA